MTNSIYVGGGCFWCTEAVFLKLKGVSQVVSGYAGGNIKNPSYKEICTGLTGHAELIKVDYDPSIISEQELLQVFFLTHNPTTLNRQGNDVGTQYRSVIFYDSDEQKLNYQKFIEDEASKYWSDLIVTSLEKLEVFYPAEEYHQNYYARNMNQGYCSVVISPKLTKLRSNFSHLIKEVI